MSAIETYLQYIANKVWARDVRTAIVNAIRQCYDDVHNPTLNTEALQAAIQAKIDAGQMAALTIGDRTITAAKLALGVIPTPDITLSQSGVPADAKKAGDEIASVRANLGALADISVDVELEWTNKKRIDDEGVVHDAGTSFYISQRVYVGAAKQAVFNGLSYFADVNQASVIYYDESGACIEALKKNDNFTLDIPANASYFRLCHYDVTARPLANCTMKLVYFPNFTAMEKEIADLGAQFDVIGLKTKTGLYCKRSYIGTSGYVSSDTNRCQTTDYISKNTVKVTCTQEYLIYMAAYNADGSFAGYLMADKTLGTSGYPLSNEISMNGVPSGYNWRVTIRTVANTAITSGIFPITVLYLPEKEEVMTSVKLNKVVAIMQGGVDSNGAGASSTKYCRTSWIIGASKIVMESGYLVTVIGALPQLVSDEYKKKIYIYREGIEVATAASFLNFGRTAVDMRALQEENPNMLFKLIIHKVSEADITPDEAATACNICVDASDFEEDSTIRTYAGRYATTENGYVVENLKSAHTLMTISADRIQGAVGSIPGNGVSKYGQLSVDGTTLKLKSTTTGNAVALKGICIWNIADGSQASTIYGLRAFRRKGANVARVVCMPTTNAGRGILEKTNKESYMQTLKQIVYDCISLDMYVVIDWHLLHTGNPLTYETEATEFFTEMAKEFYKSPNVLYEICNEPHDSGTWANITTYATAIIGTIRTYAPNAVVIVGTPDSCTNLAPVVESPLEISNVLYTYHFYKDYDYTTQLVPYVSTLPIFVTEWGAKNSASGSGASYDITKSQAFLDVLDENGISWMAWGLWQGDSTNGSNFFDKDLQGAKMRVYGGWPYTALNQYGALVVDNLVN